MMTKKEIEKEYAETDALIRASLEEERYLYEEAEREKKGLSNLSVNWNIAGHLSSKYFR